VFEHGETPDFVAPVLPRMVWGNNCLQEDFEMDHTTTGMIVVGLYFLPAIVAAIRHHPNQNAIFIQNLLLGWTILGWIVALVWANTAVAPHDRVSPWATRGVKRDPRWDDLRS
jgi:Superinfection immunity protein